MICYQKTNGLAHDLRLVPDDYVAQPGELLTEGWELPTIDALSDSAALATRNAAATIRGYEFAVQALLDAAARGLGYDSIVSACSYADEPSVASFQQQGQALRAWRSQVWKKCYDVLAQVKAGTVPQPTIDCLIAQLPAAPTF